VKPTLTLQLTSLQRSILEVMMFNPHKLGIHKVLSKIPLNALFDAPHKASLKRAVNIADLRLIAKARAHKVSIFLPFGDLLSSR
jgi:hypothetical protein